MQPQKMMILSILLSLGLASLHAQKAVDYLGQAAPIVFDQKSYSLQWSSHPSSNYYKQEYLAAGDIQARYKKMILLEAVSGIADLKSAVMAKTEELRVMKQSNPMVNYQVFDNSSKGEYMLDFLLSANNADGSINILERNVYRYKVFTDSKGNKGILLFGVSERSYGKDADKFLQNLKSTKQQLLNLVAQFALPAIAIK